jgi:hypothetical protein
MLTRGRAALSHDNVPGVTAFSGAEDRGHSITGALRAGREPASRRVVDRQVLPILIGFRDAQGRAALRDCAARTSTAQQGTRLMESPPWIKAD